MRKLSCIAAAAALVSGTALAQSAAPASPHSFTGKLALYSEYEYRGQTQTAEDPALQLTLDYAHASGFYLGTFLTNIKWLKETGDVLDVFPSELHGAEIETYDDHRVAMCFSTLGLRVPGMRIRNPNCVGKTFPNFDAKLAEPSPAGLGAVVLNARDGRPLSGDELLAG